MRSSRLVPVVLAACGLVVAALTSAAPAAPAAPAPAGPTARGVGVWTKITSGHVPNIAEPGLLRTADGVLHVAYLRDGTSESIGFTNIGPQGSVVASGTAVGGWASLTSDPKLVPAAGGGLRVVFGGIQDTNPVNPYETGQMFSATAPAAGTAWTLQPGALTDSHNGYASYGTGATTLADGTPVVAFPLNSTLTWNVGGGSADSTSTFPECCLYYSSLARTGGDVWSAFYANGSAASHQGVFVKQLVPSEGAATKAPGSTTGGYAVAPTQSVPLLARPGGGLVTAYCVGYPTCRSIGVWRVGSGAAVAVPGSKDAREYAMATDPSGRLWVVWSTSGGQVRFARSARSGFAFGAVTTIAAPAGRTVYSLSLSAATGSADLVLGDGSSLWHRRVLPGLRLGATPTHWKRTKKQKVVVHVTDAGAPVKGAQVAGGGDSCTTGTTGRCTLVFPAGPAKRFSVVAHKSGYGPAKVRLVRR